MTFLTDSYHPVRFLVDSGIAQRLAQLARALGGQNVPARAREEREAFTRFVRIYKRDYIAEISEHPQTIGYALVDSPVGLVAWMLDHDADSYEKISHAFLDGQPTGDLTRDRIVDNITLYWLTNSATSAARLYWEEGRSLEAAFKHPPVPVSLPVAFLAARVRVVRGHRR
jgi:hypothetical protein